MSISEIWIISFLLHFLGDYILQNEWMALNKKLNNWYGFFACFIHCLTYSIPFLLIVGWTAFFWIFITHFILDKWNIVSWFISFKNNTNHIENFGFSNQTPIHISFWLYIITDNIFHFFCNTFIIWVYYTQI